MTAAPQCCVVSAVDHLILLFLGLTFVFFRCLNWTFKTCWAVMTMIRRRLPHTPSVILHYKHDANPNISHWIITRCWAWWTSQRRIDLPPGSAVARCPGLSVVSHVCPAVFKQAQKENHGAQSWEILLKVPEPQRRCSNNSWSGR